MADICSFIINQNKLEKDSGQLLESISEHYRKRFETARLQQQKSGSLAAGLLLNWFADIGRDDEIILNNNGKPFVPGKMHFSISHSDEYTILAVSEKFPIGIDIERTGRVTPKIIRKVSLIDPSSMSEKELAFEWTRVEAMLKQEGTGFWSDPMLLDRSSFVFSSCEVHDHCISCACSGVHSFELSEVSFEVQNKEIIYKTETIFRKDNLT